MLNSLCNVISIFVAFKSIHNAVRCHVTYHLFGMVYRNLNLACQLIKSCLTSHKGNINLDIGPPLNDVSEAAEGSREDEEDVGGVNINGLLSTATQVRDLNDCSLHHFQEALLHPLPAHITLKLTPFLGADLIHFIQKHNS